MSRTLFIIHGWAYSIEPWADTVILLEKAGVSVKQLRVPGLTTPTDHAWTIDQYVEWLHGELQDTKNPIVLGHSNGGRIAMHYLEKYPKAFQHLILLNSAGIELPTAKLSLKRRIIAPVARALRPLKRIPLLKKIVYRLLGSDYGAAPPHMQVTLTNMLATDKTFDPSFITVPTSLLWGEDDTTTPLAMGRRLHESIKGSTLRTFPDWRHAPYRTHPQELTDAILAVLEEQS